ncbi:MAG: glycosyltransferase family 4 protein [Candidatus Omnitrophica bacterium]|nr:glycosyltransferase family 4 protein [Candidatus Omnitrophota bacterium]
MIDIILDARMIGHSGIGTYIRGLIEGFNGNPAFQKYSFAAAGPREQALKFNAPIYSIQEQFQYPSFVKRCRLWHSPHYNIPFFKPKGVRLVATTHDLIHWIFRREFYSPVQALYTQLFFKRIAQTADKIIAVSCQTKDDLIQYFKVPHDKITVIHEGVQPSFFETPAQDIQRGIRDKYGLPENFFLYVGLLKPHKNVKRLIEVFKKLRSNDKIDSSLVLVGKKDPKYPSGFQLLEDLKTGDGIYHVSRVESQTDLACLYSSARALIHPSFYEGFGLTCLEAMACGTPVIVSRVASLPEVVGDSGYFVDPYSEDSIREAFVQMEEREELRKDLGERGRQRAREFSWSKTAQETVRLYEEVLGE